MAIASELPEAITRGFHHASRRAPQKTTIFIKNQPKGTFVKRPIEFLSSTVGRQQLDRELKRLGLELNEFRILTPDAPSLSLVSQCPNGDQVLIRLFSFDAARERDHEFRLRQSQYGNLFAAPASVRIEHFAGFPSIVVGLIHPGTQIDFDTVVKDYAIARFQIGREIQSISIMHQARPSPAKSASDLVDDLLKMARIPGPHVEQCLDIAGRVPVITDYLCGLATVLVPSVRLNKSHFYVSLDSSTCFLGGATWTAGNMGDQWGTLNVFESELRQLMAEEDRSLDFDLDAVLLNAEVKRLHESARKFDLGAVQTYADQVQSRLNIISPRR